MQELGTLKRLKARDVWSHEAQDFTPWLKDNITLLGEALGMDLDLVEREVPVGPFAADLVAKDVSSDRWVVIENQLSPTDHGHLGQLLTYGAGTEASVFVWISPEFREEHRAALDWLNEHSDKGSLFFGVVIELLAIDESLPAPNLRPVSFPNEWTKDGGRNTGPQPVSERGKAYKAFFGDLLERFKDKFPGETTAASSRVVPQAQLVIGIGRAGLGNRWAFTADKRFRVGLYIDFGDARTNEAVLQQLRDHAEEIESALAHPLDWDEIEGRRACRIASYFDESPVTILDDPETLEKLKVWGIDEMKRMRDAFRPHIRSLNTEVLD